MEFAEWLRKWGPHIDLSDEDCREMWEEAMTKPEALQQYRQALRNVLSELERCVRNPEPRTRSAMAEAHGVLLGEAPKEGKLR